MKLAMMRRIAHQTRGEIRPLTPVQDHALSGSAMSVTPLFKRSSETNTQITLNASCSHGLRKPEGRSCIRFFSSPSFRRNQFRSHVGRTSSELIGVRKPPQDGVLTRRTEIFNRAPEYRIEKRICVHHVEVERDQFAIEMQLRLIIKRVAVVILQSLLQRPSDDVAQRVEIEVQIEGDAVIEPHAFGVNRVVADEGKTEGDNFPRLPPDEEARPFWHLLAESAEIIFGKCLEFEWRTLMDGEIERMNVVNPGRNVIDDLHVDFRRALR